MSGFYAEIETDLESKNADECLLVVAGAERPRQRIADPRLTAPDRSGSAGKGAVKHRLPAIGWVPFFFLI